jgi:hypothetical protein
VFVGEPQNLHQLVHRYAQRFLAIAESQHLNCGGVDVDEPAARVLGGDGVGDPLQDRSEFVLGLAHERLQAHVLQRDGRLRGQVL